jgi:hypothetical protein
MRFPPIWWSWIELQQGVTSGLAWQQVECLEKFVAGNAMDTSRAYTWPLRCPALRTPPPPSIQVDLAPYTTVRPDSSVTISRHLVGAWDPGQAHARVASGSLYFFLRFVLCSRASMSIFAVLYLLVFGELKNCRHLLACSACRLWFSCTKYRPMLNNKIYLGLACSACRLR